MTISIKKTQSYYDWVLIRSNILLAFTSLHVEQHEFLQVIS